jgi:predicted  nucleic acid-binding Zn-ribbon protein
MKERLIALYQLHKIDKDLEEIESLKGDLPQEIEEKNELKADKENEYNALKEEYDSIVQQEAALKAENDLSFKRIQKNDEVIRVSGSVKTNEEYNALANEMDMAYEVIEKNDELLEKEIEPKKTETHAKLKELKMDLDKLSFEIKEKQDELDELKRQNEEEERELNEKRDNVLNRIQPEDLDMYERINKVKFGDAIALVRKGSCLGCYNSIPPQREIEIKMAERFFSCEACGRIMVHEDLIKDVQ